jgi:hypothetical protein
VFFTWYFFPERLARRAFWLEFNGLKKKFIVIIANGINWASVLYFKDPARSCVCGLSFNPINGGKAS